MKKAFPHILTLANLLCGVLSIRAIFNDEVSMALAFVAIAAFLDFFDGLAARLLGVAGDLGKQLDSLADNVTFGVVPAFMYLAIGDVLNELPSTPMEWALFVAALLVSAMATLRLAKFNIDARQVSGFIGMPTPGNTLLIGSFYYLFFKLPESFMAKILGMDAVLLIVILLTAFWQIMPLKLIALKFKNWKWQGNQQRYIFLVLSLAAILLFRTEAIPIVILLYLIISLAQTALKSNE
jgi:CDP-diacylglycerol--serine O-phosphatidyltransferase